ncbi:MAG: DUF937 domain-containing protein [Candidatus Eisenbacteria bacterium]
MSLIDTLQQQLSGPVLDQIGHSLGTDRAKASTAVAAALPVLLGALGRNAADPRGADALHQAIARDHDGGLLDSLGPFLQAPESGAGAGILKHLLGARQPRVESGLGQAVGLDQNQMGKLLMTLAPIVLAALGKAQRKDGLDASALSSILGAERQKVETQGPAGLLGALLDSDGNGDVDLADIARKGLGGLFGR